MSEERWLREFCEAFPQFKGQPFLTFGKEECAWLSEFYRKNPKEPYGMKGEPPKASDKLFFALGPGYVVHLGECGYDVYQRAPLGLIGGVSVSYDTVSRLAYTGDPVVATAIRDRVKAAICRLAGEE